ncbi:putative phosphatase [compost metagenome]
MDSSASKSQAIQIILQRLGLSREEIMAVGDNFNDIDMLSFAGLGIAMANAPDEVKRYADDVTLSNDKDGLKYSLEKYVIASEQ